MKKPSKLYKIELELGISEDDLAGGDIDLSSYSRLEWIELINDLKIKVHYLRYSLEVTKP